MSLKKEFRKNLDEVLSKNGMPKLIDKTFNSMWETFSKTQPNSLNTNTKIDPDVWGSLKNNLLKFSIKEQYADQTIARLHKIFGEKPTPSQIKDFMV